MAYAAVLTGRVSTPPEWVADGIASFMLQADGRCIDEAGRVCDAPIDWCSVIYRDEDAVRVIDAVEVGQDVEVRGELRVARLHRTSDERGFVLVSIEASLSPRS